MVKRIVLVFVIVALLSCCCSPVVQQGCCPFVLSFVLQVCYWTNMNGTTSSYTYQAWVCGISLLFIGPIYHSLCCGLPSPCPCSSVCFSHQTTRRVPNTLPLHIALQQPDWDKFVDAMDRELKQHAELKHLKIVHKFQVPKSTNPIHMV